MLTIFTIPKPFQNHIGIIQRNAIKSWSELKPGCEMILFGNDSGVKETAQEFKARYEPLIQKNEYGTPYLNEVFSKAQKLAGNDLLCYVNCDIILMDDFLRAVTRLADYRRPFLMAGARWNYVIDKPLDFSDGWQEVLRNSVLKGGCLEPPTGIDYFVFRKGLWDFIPPFAIGRTAWDNWLVYKARRRRAAVIDATGVVMAVHQAHDLLCGDNKQNNTLYETEVKYNRALAGGMRRLFMMHDATHVLTGDGIRPAFQWRYLKSRMWRMVAPVVYSPYARRIRNIFSRRIKK